MLSRTLLVVTLVVGFVGIGLSSAEEAKVDAKVTTLLDQLGKTIDGASAVSDPVKAFVKKTLVPLCTNKVWVKETLAQNAKKVSLDEIKKTDQAWIDAEEELAVQTEKLNNACAKEIVKIIKANEAVVEAFVMDDQGAVVGENALTSDYWQGDEAKWKNSFAGGKGGVDIGKEKFDKSANATLQQVSLPIVNEDGKVVGAVTFGVSVSKLAVASR